MTQYTHVLYHRGCPDGFGAAWAAWKVLADRAKYIPVTYDQPVPDLPSDAHVLMVDFCYPRPICMEIANKVESLRVIDHHQTSADGMAGVPWATFDMSHSGAYLSWVHFHGLNVPEFVLYLEDRDLWLFKMPYSREIAAALGSYPYEFTLWEQLFTMGMEKLKLDGGTILRFQRQKVDEMCAKMYWKDFDGHRVPCANATTLFSEVGDRLCQIHPDAPFAAYYFIRPDGKVQWGLRSPGRFDVTPIAKKRGGGGHPGAAGFVSSITDIL